MSHIISLDFKLLEKVIIYNALFDTTYLESIIEYAKPTYFEDRNVRTVFESLHEFYQEHQKVPAGLTELKLHMVDVDKRASLRGVVESFLKIDKNYDKDVLLKNTERFLREKAVYNCLLNTSVEVQAGTIDSNKIMKDFEAACGISLLESLGMDYLESIDKHCEELLKTNKTISTGWKWLDDRIGGGYMADGRAIYIFYGVTNVGKSIFLGNAAANILSQGKVVILITLEMSEHMYAKRTSSHLSRISMDDLASQIEPLKNELNTYKMKNGDGKLIIKEFPPQTVTPMQIKAYIDRLIKKGIKPDAIVIDYMNLIAPPEKGLGSYEAVKKVTEMVRAMSYYYECPIISATQTNRSGYNEANPGLETVSESIGLAQTADAQFSIWSEEGDIDLGQIHIGINKNRFGKVGDHTIMEIDYPTLTLTDGSNVGNMFKSDKKIIPGSLLKIKGNLLDTLNAIENSGKKDDN